MRPEHQEFGQTNIIDSVPNVIPLLGLALLNALRPSFYTLNTHSWLNWVNEDEVGLKEKPEDTRYIKKITSK